MFSNGKKKPDSGIGDLGWMPFEAAAAKLKRSVARIRAQAKDGKLQRGVHFRRAESGGLELHVEAYLAWLAETSPPKRQKSLIERINESHAGTRPTTSAAELASINELRAKPAESRETPERRKPKLVPVSVWAEMMFGEYAPGRKTLLNWAHNGKILPVPVKMGRQYFCSPEARYIDPRAERISRMVNG